MLMKKLILIITVLVVVLVSTLVMKIETASKNIDNLDTKVDLFYQELTADDFCTLEVVECEIEKKTSKR